MSILLQLVTNCGATAFQNSDDDVLGTKLRPGDFSSENFTVTIKRSVTTVGVLSGVRLNAGILGDPNVEIASDLDLSQSVARTSLLPPSVSRRVATWLRLLSLTMMTMLSRSS